MKSEVSLNLSDSKQMSTSFDALLDIDSFLPHNWSHRTPELHKVTVLFTKQVLVAAKSKKSLEAG